MAAATAISVLARLAATAMDVEKDGAVFARYVSSLACRLIFDRSQTKFFLFSACVNAFQ